MRRLPYVIVIAALMLAALACSLSGGEDDSPTPTPLPSFTPTAPTTPTQQVIIVTATPTPTATTAQGGGIPPTLANCSPQTTWPVYTVQAGDTLGTLALRTGTTVVQLVAANCLSNPEWIYVGQRLYVPIMPGPLPTDAPAATNTPGGTQPAQTAAPTTSGDVPVFSRDLVVNPYWLDAFNRAVTNAEVVRIDAGEVSNADVVYFYLNDPSGGAPISVGQDVDPWDGAFVDYAFPQPGSYTFYAVAQNDQAQITSSIFLILYDPGVAPPGGEPNVLFITPYVSLEDGWYTLTAGATVTISWPDAPVGAMRVNFIMTPTGTEMTGDVIGSDLAPFNGAAITWSPPAGVLAHLQAEASMPDGTIRASEYAKVIT